MRVCIEKSALGTPLSLVINDDGSLEWSDNESCDVCLFGPRDSHCVQMEDLARMCGVSLEGLSVSSTPQSRAFSTLGVDPSSVPWFLAMGRDQFRERIANISTSVCGVTQDPQISRYIPVYKQCRDFLRGLSRPRIDVQSLRQSVSECDSGLSVLKSIKSFTPGPDGLAPRIVYDQSGTATGRLTVLEGPSILTLPKSTRSVIRSSQGGGIFEVDFVSLEPRFVLHAMGKKAPRDIYEDIRTSVFGGELTRKIVKTATISALYGSSAQLMSDLTGLSHTARSVTRRVREYFGADELGHRLSDETGSGILHNHYGRPLPGMRRGEKESLLISYYVQSSCVDTVLLGFSHLCDRIKSLSAQPIYVIHDALLIDVPDSSIDDFMEICAQGVDLEVGHFELGVNRIS